MRLEESIILQNTKAGKQKGKRKGVAATDALERGVLGRNKKQNQALKNNQGKEAFVRAIRGEGGTD